MPLSPPALWPADAAGAVYLPIVVQPGLRSAASSGSRRRATARRLCPCRLGI